MKMKSMALLVLIASLAIPGCGSAQPPAPTITLSASASPASTNTIIPTLITPSLAAFPTECIDHELTPEECINAGTHEYSTTTQILFDGTGQSCSIDDSDITISFKFLTGDNLHYTDSFGTEVDFARKDHNIYEGEHIQPDGKFEWKNTITFTDAGFTEEANSYDLEKNELMCTFVWEQKIITPSPTTTQIPQTGLVTPESTTIMADYISPLGVSFAYPNGWFVSELEGIISVSSNGLVQPKQPGETFSHGEILMEILVAPLEYQTSSSLLNVLGSYTNFLGIDMPDKEPAHTIELSGREFAIGTYSENYINTAAHGNRAPLFIATHFTELNTLLLDMYASPGDEAQLRKIFEDFLVSIEAVP